MTFFARVRQKLGREKPAGRPEEKTMDGTVTIADKPPCGLLDLPAISATVPNFDRLYACETSEATLVLPASRRGGPAPERQRIVSVRNRYTFEETLFNPHRAHRPMMTIGSAAPVAAEDAACDLCDPVGSMAREPCGDHAASSSSCCYVAANIAPCAARHVLVVSRAPVHWPDTGPATLLADLLATAARWVAALDDPSLTHASVAWDHGPRASASQCHLHWQLVARPGRFFGRAEQMHDAAVRYGAAHPASPGFWPDVVAVHAALGLCVAIGDGVSVLAWLTPVRERELVVVGPAAGAPAFARGLQLAMATLLSTATRSFSLALTFELPSSPSYPAVARMVDRGDDASPPRRSDAGAMEFYGASDVATDPFDLGRSLRCTPP